MIDLIIKLEDALNLAGIDYELKSLSMDGETVYVLNIDGTEAFILKVKEEDFTDEQT